MKCSRAGCELEGTHASGTGLYCAMHNTMVVMRANCKKRDVHQPTMEQLEDMVPDPLVCHVCEMEMMWKAADRRASVSLQHWRDGTLSLICHSCNSRMNANEYIPPAGFRRCAMCEQDKPESSFFLIPSTGKWHPYCMPCNAARNRIRR